MRDERKIKRRNPKRHVVSEEKWGEGTTWNDILQEGREREKEMTLEERKAKDEQKYDKAMALQIPGTKPLEPIVKPKPPPEGYIRKSVEPSGGGELFETLLTTSTEIFRLVSNSGRNVVSMSTPITLLVEEGECDVNKLGELGIETKKIGGQCVLETLCIADTWADISCTTDEVRDALGRATLTDANGEVTSVGGVTEERRRINFVSSPLINKSPFASPARLETWVSMEM